MNQPGTPVHPDRETLRMRPRLGPGLLCTLLFLTGCGIATQPVAIDTWVLKSDREHPEGLRFLIDSEPDPVGEALTDQRIFTLEMDGSQRFLASLPCIPSCCIGGNWLSGAPPGKRLESGRTDETGRVRMVWSPPSRWHRLVLMKGATLGFLFSGSTMELPAEAYRMGRARLEVRTGPSILDGLARAAIEKISMELASRDIGREIATVGHLRMLAESGHPVAQYYMGVIHSFDEILGKGRSREAAVQWFRRSASQGYGPAREALKGLESAAPR